MRTSHRIPTWVAVTGGAALGLLGAFGGTVAWRAFGRRGGPVGDPREVATQVDLFRLPCGAHREMFLGPAGPDANGEPALANALFPGEDPPRELASLLLANVSPDEVWTLDLTNAPLSCRRSSGAAWEPLCGFDAQRAAGLDPAQALRLRGLGAGCVKVTLEPRSLLRLLVALPANCRIADLSDVQWGTTPLVRDQLDLERIRRFREDPSAVTTGR